MPYGDLAHQVCQRFATYADLDSQKCTIEEREEYEPLIDHGFVVYAGVDYGRILARAEEEADIILWDGGNNDFPSTADPAHLHRGPSSSRAREFLPSGRDEYSPGGRRRPQQVRHGGAPGNRGRRGGRGAGEPARPSCGRPRRFGRHAELLPGARVLAVEDGPTLTHGEMRYGAAVIAAKQAGAASFVDPSPYAVGSIRDTYAKYPNAVGILPAMGYGPTQVAELEETIRRTPCDVVVIGTPIDLRRVLKLDKKAVRVRYDLREQVPGRLEAEVRKAVGIGVSSDLLVSATAVHQVAAARVPRIVGCRSADNRWRCRPRAPGSWIAAGARSVWCSARGPTRFPVRARC